MLDDEIVNEHYIGSAISDEGLIAIVWSGNLVSVIAGADCDREATELDVLDAASHFLGDELAPFQVWHSTRIPGAIHARSLST